MSDRNLAIAGGVFIAFVLAGLLGLYDASLGVVLQGVALGLGTGLMAVGLVLVYRTARIINFAYGAMGTLAASVAAGLKLGRFGVNWAVAAAVGIAVGVLVGVLVEVLVIRRFANSPRLILTVATVGLAQALGGLALFVPDWLGASALVPQFPTQLSRVTVRIPPVTLNGNHLLLAALSPVVLGALVWFLLRSDAGIAVRGMAENLDRARLLGIPVNNLNMLLWGVAGGLAAITVVLKAPTQGLTVDAAAGPTLLLAPLAAAVIVGMRSILWTFLAGVALEVLDQLVQINLSSRTWTYVVFLGVIVAGLLFQERPGGRGDGADGAFSIVGVGHALPDVLAKLPEVRMARVALAAVVAAAVVLIPVVGTASQVNTATIAVVYAMTALSLVVLTGWGGAVSLGQIALVGVGGVVTANLISGWNLDFFVTIALSALAAGLVAAVIGIPALRVSGQLLAVTTLAFAVAMQIHVINPANYESLVPSDYPRPKLFGSVSLDSEASLYVLALVLLAFSVFVVANLRRTRTGRVIAAGRDNARAASAAGINTVRAKITAFVFSGMFAGVAGAIHAVALRGIGTNTYEAADSLLVFSMAVIGGIASIGGTLAGVALISWLGYAFPRLQLLLTGVGLLVILLIIPGGLGQAAERLRDRFAKAVARRRGVALHEQLELVDLSAETPEQQAAAAALRAEREERGARADRAAASAGLALGDGDGAQRSAALLQCAGIESGYGSLQVLFGVDMDVAPGDVLALLGTNGAGKSTMFKAAMGLLPAWKGKVVFDGTDITGMATEKVARLGLAMMPGGKGIFPTLTVGENMRLATWMMRRDPARAGARTGEMLAMFPILRERWDQQAANLSGGEQQQLSIAMTFVTDPKLAFIDELSLGLAPTVVGMLVDKVRQLHEMGTTIVVVEQSINVALLMCERALFMEKGQVRFRGPTAGLLDRPDILRAVFIGSADGKAPERARAGALAPPEQRASRGVTLECRSLSKRFGGITAVDDVTLRVEPGRIVGLIGHNGAGKTTLFDVITGFLDANGGRVDVGGEDITDLAPHRRAALDIGRSFQEARLFPSLTVKECIKVALERHLANRDPVAAALHLPASTASERSADARADELIALLGLVPFQGRATGELSTGTRRIVELACLLAQDPAVILLDEPTAGVAQAETEALVPLLRKIQAETGCSMVVIEHDMALLSKLCDEFVALEQGRVIARGTPEQVLADPQVVASYLGTDEDVVHRSGPRGAAGAGAAAATATAAPPHAVAPPRPADGGPG
ncbi:MAG: ATP-binding cassette domain-containing protein [Actinobacteria bacterium]|nr:ATP-binding cassette domain-containing protein [Actinomycetota bacterium]